MREKELKYEKLRLIWGYMIVKGQRNCFMFVILVRVRTFRIDTLNESCVFFLLTPKKPTRKPKNLRQFPKLKIMQGDFITKKLFQKGGRQQ